METKVELKLIKLIKNKTKHTKQTISKSVLFGRSVYYV